MRLLFLLLFCLGCQQGHVGNKPVLSTGRVDVFKSVELVRVYDGDTFIINLPNTIPDVFSREISVRIRHIDTAEMKGSSACEKGMAMKAKMITESLLKNAKKITLENVARDKYFRLLADTNVDGVDVGKVLLDKGYAVQYEGDKKFKVDWCKRLK